MSIALGNGGGKPAAAARSSHSDDSEEYASYRKMLDGFVSGLDDMLSDWCAKNSPAGTPVGTLSSSERSPPDITSQLSGTGMDPSPSSSNGSLDGFVADASADIGRDESGSDDDVIDGAEDYNAPSIAENYNFHSLRRTEEVTTVERLHASSELWFYPTLSRADALRMLENKEVGVFMVRNSSKPGNFALSMRQESPDPYIQHYLIQQTLDGLQVQGAEHFFDSLEDLIAHYCDYISGGMPTNLILPICAAEPTSRSELFAAMEKESTMLKLLEMSVLKPAAMAPSQVACLQGGLVDMRQDVTRVCPPRASFRWSVRMPMIQSVFVPTPQLPLTCPPGSMSLARGEDASRQELPPALPPKRRSATMVAQEGARMAPSDKRPGHQSPTGQSGSRSHDVPPPLPPKQKSTLSRAADPAAAAQDSAQHGRRVAPPIPRRGIFPGTLPEEPEPADDVLGPSRRPSVTQRRHTLSSVDRQSLTRTRSNGSDAGKDRNQNEAKDEDGYLLPFEVNQLAESHQGRLRQNQQANQQQQRSSSGARLASASSASRTSGASIESHSYIDIDLIVGTEPASRDARAPPLPEVPTTDSSEAVAGTEDAQQHEGGGSPAQRSTVKAQRVLGIDEPEPRRASAPKVNPSAWIKNRAANIGVMSRFGKTATERVVISISKYAASKNTVLGQNIDMFLTTANSKPHDDNPIKFAEEIRGFMNSLKNYLLGPGRTELNEIISRSYALAGGEEINIQLILERALHKAVLKPLKSLIYKSFIDHMSRNGSLSNLRDSLKAGKQMTPKDLGIRERLIPPQGPSLHQIGQHLIKMQKAFSPTTKIQHMLAAVQAIYKSVKDTQCEIANEQLVMGADDFLPMMVYILCQLEVWKMEVETEYLWALLDESQKVGEGGYYLTTISGAVRAIGILASQPSTSPEPPVPWASTKPKTQASVAISTPNSTKNSDLTSSSSSSSGNSSSAARKLSDDVTAASPAGSAMTQGQGAAVSTSPLSMVSPTTGDIRLPCIADMQGFMRIHIDDVTGKTLSVHTLPINVDTTVADTCRMVAKKFDIKEPELFGLFQVAGKAAFLLRDNDKPQVIKSDWLADNTTYGQLHPGVERYFGYRLRRA